MFDIAGKNRWWWWSSGQRTRLILWLSMLESSWNLHLSVKLLNKLTVKDKCGFQRGRIQDQGSDVRIRTSSNIFSRAKLKNYFRFLLVTSWQFFWFTNHLLFWFQNQITILKTRIYFKSLPPLLLLLSFTNQIVSAKFFVTKQNFTNFVAHLHLRFRDAIYDCNFVICEVITLPRWPDSIQVMWKHITWIGILVLEGQSLAI